MKIKKIVSRVLRRNKRHPPPLGFEAKEHFIYLVSYPKSGVTWLRFLLANALSQPEALGWRQYGQIVPDAHSKEERAYIEDASSGFNRAPVQFIKTHSPYRRELRSAVYLARDGRDVLTSYYHYLSARRQRAVSLRDLIKGAGLDYGSWEDHVLGWLQSRCERLLVVRYEDLRQDTAGALGRIFSFVGFEASDDAVHHAIAASSFERMRKGELELYQEAGRTLSGEHASQQGDGLFVRKGKIGDWRNLFQEEDVRLFWSHQGRGMRALGYHE